MLVDPTLLVSVVATAMIYVLSAYGLIVTYRVAGVFNLALGYQAAIAAFVYWQLTVDWGLNRYLAAAIVMLGWAPLTGLAIQQSLFRRRREVLTSIIITIGLGVAISGAIQLIWKTNVVRTVPSIFGARFFRVGDTSFTVNEIGVIVTALVIGTLVWLLLNRSRTGTQMRAVVDDPELSGASGIPYARVSAIAWIIGSMLASASGILVAPLLTLDVALLTALVVNAFAVAVFAGLASLPMVLLGALLLAYAQGVTDLYPDTFHFTGGSPRSALPFIMLAIVLLVHPAARRTVRVVGGGMQRQLRERASGAIVPAVVLAIALAAAAASIDVSWAFSATQSACYAIAALSLVLLIGASAQISLCQVTFMGFGAVMMGKLLGHGVPWGIALLAGTITAGLAGLLISLSAFRLRGLFLALITYAFAYAAMIILFQTSVVIGQAGLFVDRPAFFGIDFSNDRNYLGLVMAILVLSIVAVGGLLRGPWGRALQTLSAGDAVAGVSGLPVRMWKMAVFVVSSALAGLAGGLFAATNLNITSSAFVPDLSLSLLVFVVVGGITSPAGAVVAGFLAYGSGRILELVVGNPGNWSLLLFGLMAMDTSIRYPAGMAGGIPMIRPGLRALALRLRGDRSGAVLGVDSTPERSP